MNYSNAVSRFSRAAIFRSYYYLTGRRNWLTDLDRLERIYHASREEVESNVRSSLSALLSHAVDTVPYYRDLALRGRPSPDNAIQFLQQMPILTKDIIRREGQRLASARPGAKLRWNTSGGSTGEPVQLLQDGRMNRGRVVGKLLYMRWAGHQMGEPHVLIWGVDQETFGKGVSIHDRIYQMVHNQTCLNCHKITTDVLYTWVDRINALRPTLIEAYVDAVYELSRLIIREGVEVAKPRSIIVGAGVLTLGMRDVISQAFQCPVLNRYGSREVSDMACSCRHNSELHVNELSYYLEILDDDGVPCGMGVEGNILVTLFTNYSMPLIRYRIEDRGVWAMGTCPCGRTTRRLGGVMGRQFDFLLAGDGTKIHAGALVDVIFPVLSIRRYQYRQTRKDHVVLAVVPAEGYNKEAVVQDIQQPLKQVRELLAGVSVELAIVDEITPSKSGKYRYILNESSGVRGTSCGKQYEKTDDRH